MKAILRVTEHGQAIIGSPNSVFEILAPHEERFYLDLSGSWIKKTPIEEDLTISFLAGSYGLLLSALFFIGGVFWFTVMVIDAITHPWRKNKLPTVRHKVDSWLQNATRDS